MTDIAIDDMEALEMQDVRNQQLQEESKKERFFCADVNTYKYRKRAAFFFLLWFNIGNITLALSFAATGNFSAWQYEAWYFAIWEIACFSLLFSLLVRICCTKTLLRMWFVFVLIPFVATTTALAIVEVVFVQNRCTIPLTGNGTLAYSNKPTFNVSIDFEPGSALDRRIYYSSESTMVKTVPFVGTLFILFMLLPEAARALQNAMKMWFQRRVSKYLYVIYLTTVSLIPQAIYSLVVRNWPEVYAISTTPTNFWLANVALHILFALLLLLGIQSARVNERKKQGYIDVDSASHTGTSRSTPSTREGSQQRNYNSRAKDPDALYSDEEEEESTKGVQRL